VVAHRSALVVLVLLAPALLPAQEPAPSPSPAMKLQEEVVVQAVRADERTPVTTAEIPREELERAYHGQEMPVLLSRTPSIVQYSETGSGAGYSYFSLRGLHQTRVNMTLDGVPLNDPEESAVFFANFGDFASALQSVQVQRGVGISSVGAASFAGSVNFESQPAHGPRSLELEAGLGSWDSQRASAALRSGTLPGGFALYARGSLLKTDGYRERSGVEQGALYFGLARQDDRSLLKVFAFRGHEETDLAFLAPDAAALEADPRVNVMAPGETDAYDQDFLHVHYTRQVSAAATASLQAYTTGADGAFRLYDDPTTRDTLRSYGIDGRTLGLLGNVTVRRGETELAAGLHANTFERDHVQDEVGGPRAYLNTGHKSELGAFARVGHTRGRLHLYGDAQVRHARFSYDGTVAQEPVEWTFFNPRAGMRWTWSGGWSVYASGGRSTREPARNDLFAGEDDPTITYDPQAVEPERVLDLEAGVERRSGRLHLQANVYTLSFENEIAATGELSVAGFPLRRNAPRSFRRGVEVDATWQARPDLRLTLAASASHDRLDEWTQFVDVYDEAGEWVGQESVVHRDVRPLLTPSHVVSGGIDWSPWLLELGLRARHTSRLFLDNTEQESLSTPAWASADLHASLDLSRYVPTGSPRLRVDVTNLFDERIYASGYSYLFLTRGASGDVAGGTPYFYPLATRSVYVTLQARF
jgi:iron complex outermembrane receptor protein